MLILLYKFLFILTLIKPYSLIHWELFFSLILDPFPFNLSLSSLNINPSTHILNPFPFNLSLASLIIFFSLLSWTVFLQTLPLLSASLSFLTLILDCFPSNLTFALCIIFLSYSYLGLFSFKPYLCSLHHFPFLLLTWLFSFKPFSYSLHHYPFNF